MRNPYQARRSAQSGVNLNSSVERYRHFIKTIVTTQQVWGLYLDGWAIGATSQGQHVLPLWSEKSLSQFCKNDSWSQHEPTSIDLENFIFKMIPYVAKEKYLLSIMMTPDGQSVFLEPKKVLSDLKTFLYDVHTRMPDFFEKNPNVPLPRKIRLTEI